MKQISLHKHQIKSIICFFLPVRKWSVKACRSLQSSVRWKHWVNPLVELLVLRHLCVTKRDITILQQTYLQPVSSEDFWGHPLLSSITPLTFRKHLLRNTFTRHTLHTSTKIRGMPQREVSTGHKCKHNPVMSHIILLTVWCQDLKWLSPCGWGLGKKGEECIKEIRQRRKEESVQRERW